MYSIILAVVTISTDTYASQVAPVNLAIWPSLL